MAVLYICCIIDVLYLVTLSLSGSVLLLQQRQMSGGMFSLLSRYVFNEQC